MLYNGYHMLKIEYMNYINAIYFFFNVKNAFFIDIYMGYSYAPFSASSIFKALQLIYNSIHAYMHVTLHPSPTHDHILSGGCHIIFLNWHDYQPMRRRFTSIF